MLENEIIPLFYTRSADGLPRAWINRMKTTIKWVTPRFNTDRMVSDYTQKFYKSAAEKWQYLTADSMSKVKAFSKWKSKMESNWSEFDIKDVQVQVKNGEVSGQVNLAKTKLKVGSQLIVKALIKLGKINPEDVSVELYHGSVDSWGKIKNGSAFTMDYNEKNGEDGTHLFTGLMECKTSGRQGFAVRILPRNEILVNPHELGLILWENTK